LLKRKGFLSFTVKKRFSTKPVKNTNKKPFICFLPEINMAEVISPVYILIAFIAISIIAAIILTIIELKLKKKVDSYKNKTENIYVSELRKIASSNKENEKKLDMINDLAKKFFSEFFNTSPFLTYSEMVEEFKKRKEQKPREFCELMLFVYYSGEKITNEKINEIIRKLKEIIEKNLNYEINNLDFYKRMTPELENFSIYKKQSEVVLKNIMLDNSSLVKEENIDNIKIIINQNPKIIKELEKSSMFLKKAHKIFISIFRRIYPRLPQSQQNRLREIVTRWKEEQKSIVTKNPFLYQLLELKLMDKYFKKISEYYHGRVFNIF